MPANKSALLRYRIIDGCLTNPNRRYPTMNFIIAKIQEQIGTSLSASMFTKDIENMRIIYGAPIKFDRYNKGYKYTEAGFSIKEFPLTHADIEALDFSTGLLQQFKGTRMFEQFDNAIDKVIEGYRISKITGRSQLQVIQVEEPCKPGNSDGLDTILEAIIEKAALEISYHPFGRAAKVHEFSPYLLKEYRNRWYTVGFSGAAKKIITLALDRIRNISSSTAKYECGKNFNSHDFFKYSLGITQQHNETPQDILLSFTAAQAPYIISQPLHHSQTIVCQTETEVHVQLKIYITQELKMSILSFGANIKVLEPAILRNEIRTIIENMRSLY